MRFAPGLLAASILALAAPAAADPPRVLGPLAVPSPNGAFDPDLDIPLTLVAGAGWILTEVAKPSLAPSACRWCDASLNPLDASVRKALVWSRPDTANTLSNVAVFGVAPVSALGLTALAAWYDHRSQNIPADSVLILEALALSMNVNQAVKYATGRARPYVRFGNRDVLDGSPDAHDADLSFFSGHTTAAFALAAASGTLSSMRGYRFAPWVWTQGLALAFASGYLRLAADRHYLTDVLTGALFGAASGALVPLLHRPWQAGRARFVIGPVAGPGLGVAGVW